MLRAAQILSIVLALLLGAGLTTLFSTAQASTCASYQIASLPVSQVGRPARLIEPSSPYPHEPYPGWVSRVPTAADPTIGVTVPSWASPAPLDATGNRLPSTYNAPACEVYVASAPCVLAVQ